MSIMSSVNCINSVFGILRYFSKFWGILQNLDIFYKLLRYASKLTKFLRLILAHLLYTDFWYFLTASCRSVCGCLKYPTIMNKSLNHTLMYVPFNQNTVLHFALHIQEWLRRKDFQLVLEISWRSAEQTQNGSKKMTRKKWKQFLCHWAEMRRRIQKTLPKSRARLIFYAIRKFLREKILKWTTQMMKDDVARTWER